MQVQKARPAPPPTGLAAATLTLFDDGPGYERWPRRTRALFILTAASLCWAIPAALLYWAITPG